ncbi:14362_t:CDS:2, partial [Entrophospora sp. SA101]
NLRQWVDELSLARRVAEANTGGNPFGKQLSENQKATPDWEISFTNVNQGNNSGSDDRRDNNNKPKCSKCQVNEAEHGGLVITNKDTGEEKVIYDQPICEPCANELLKCQECKAKKAEAIITKNSSEVLICEECHEKLKDQEHPKCKECSKELELPFFQIIDEKIKYCLECWKGEEKDYRENSCDRYDKEGKVVHGIIIGYHNESNKTQIGYVRKYSAMKDNCCDGKCQRKLDDEPVEKDTMTCNRCQEEFSQGYAVHAPDVFFCEKCEAVESNPDRGEPQQENRRNEPPQQPVPQQESGRCPQCGKKDPYGLGGICDNCQYKVMQEAHRCPDCGRRSSGGEKCIECLNRENRNQSRSEHNEYTCESENCSCVEEFKRSHQQTCAQCQKRE